MRKKRVEQMNDSFARLQMKEIAERVGQLRTNHKQSVADIVLQLELLGIYISRSTYAKMEKGELMFREDILLGLSKIWGVSLEYICTSTEYPTKYHEDLSDIITKIEKNLKDANTCFQILKCRQQHCN